MIAPIKSEHISTQESLELLYHISREIASTLDLTVVLQRVLALSMRTIGAVSGSIIIINNEEEPLEAAIIYEDEVLEHSPTRIKALLNQGLAGWVVENQEPTLILNTQRDERWIKTSRQAQKDTKAKSAISVPIIAREQLVGVITLSHPVPLFFTNEHLHLVQAIADQAAIAVVNARLYAASQHQVHVMGALADSAAAITASLKLDDVLQRIVEQIKRVLRVEVISLALISNENNSLTFRASTSGHHNIIGKRIPVDQGILGWVVETQQGAIVTDVAEDERFSPVVDQIVTTDIRALACAPILSEGEIVGVLQAVNPLEGNFDADALIVLTGIGSLAGTAIRHAQLFEELQAAHQRYRDLYNSSIDAILITNLSGEIIEANLQTIVFVGHSIDDLKHRHIRAIHDLDVEAIGDNLELISTDKTISYESELHTESERILPIQVHVHTVFFDGVEHLQWTFRDITERKELDQLRDDLISMVYHDLRSPLANVISSLDVLESIQSFDDDPTMQSLFEIAVRSTKRIERLTSSLLDFNRLEAGQPVTNISPTDARELIASSVEAVLPIANNKQQEILVRVQENIPMAEIDEGMIQRVLINLTQVATCKHIKL